MKSNRDSEKWLENNLREFVKSKSIDGICAKFIPTYLKGFPDRIILLPGGIVIFIELKSRGKAIKGLQAFWRRRLVNLGFKYLEIKNFEELENAKSYIKELSGSK